MNLRKILLVGAAAILALALAGPATAAAAEWTDEGAPIEEHAELPLFGGEVFETAAGAMLCEVDATLTAEPGGTGQVTSYETTKCMGLSGEMAGCSVVATEQVEEAPWPVHVGATDLTVTNATLLRTFNPGCAVKTIESTITSTTTETPEPSAISELEYVGFGEASINGGAAGEYKTFGSWFVEGEASGTYGIN